MALFQQKKERIIKYTQEEIKKMLIDIFYNKPIENPTRKVLLYQGCKTHGAVERSELNLNICNDPDCSSCNMMNDLIKESFEESLKKSI